MATAQELLSSIAGPEEHIVIGADRFITVPKPLQRIAVQFDHDVETVTFDCPRYWDDLDMSKMVIYINYKLPDGTLDAYPAKNIKADGDIMHFDWTISRNLTQYKGTITFLVCIKKTDTDGVEVNHWNSELCTDMYVSEGMECQEQAQMEYSDLITQLLERMTVVEGINVQAEEMQTLHDETLEAAALAKDESNYIKNSYANAYKQSVSGEVICVDDVSPLEHTVDVKVRGKNLFDISLLSTTTEQEDEPYISEVGDNYFVLVTADNYTGNGYFTTAHTLRDLCPQLEVGKTYALSGETDSVCNMIYLSGWNRVWYFTQSMQITEDMLDSKVVFYALSTVGGQSTGSCTISNIQIEEGTTATEYTSYVDPSTVTLTRCGKNLLGFAQSFSTTINGLTIDYDAESQVFTLNGTPTVASSSIRLNAYMLTKPRIEYDKNYVLSLQHISGSASDELASNVFYLGVADDPNKTHSNWAAAILPKGASSNIVKWANADLYIVNCWVYTGVTTVTYTDYKFKVQVEQANTITDYEAYNGETYIPNTDGTVENVYSLSPTMTLFTDTTGIIIDLTYNRDNNKVIGDVSTALDTLLAMQESTMTLLDNMSGGTS